MHSNRSSNYLARHGFAAGNDVIEKIKELHDHRALTVLMAEQNFNQAIKIADRGYIIVHGEIAYEGETADALKNNDLVKQYYLGA